MAIKILKKSWLHILLWAMMIIYLIVAPDLLTPVLLKNGIPMQTGESIPAESNRIAYEITGLESYIKDKEKLSNLFGWALIAPEDGISADALEREIVLISDKRKYFFPVICHISGPRTAREVREDGCKFGYLRL